jgi:hypothetical protein
MRGGDKRRARAAVQGDAMAEAMVLADTARLAAEVLARVVPVDHAVIFVVLPKRREADLFVASSLPQMDQASLAVALTGIAAHMSEAPALSFSEVVGGSGSRNCDCDRCSKHRAECAGCEDRSHDAGASPSTVH